MKTAATILAALALAGSVSAGPADNFQDGDEYGVDCGGTGGAPSCDCRTDLRNDAIRGLSWSPPVLINSNENRGDNTVARETGIVRAASDGVAADLEIAIRLDGGVYTTLFGPGLTGGLMLDHSTALESHSYADPSLWFVNQGDDTEIAACKWTVGGNAAFSTNGPDGNVGGGDDVLVDQRLTIERSYTGSDGTFVNSNNAVLTPYGDDGDDCANGKYTISGRIDVRTALRECGFTATANTATVPDTENSNVGGANGPTAASKYTEFLGKLKVQQTRQNGALRTLEVVLKEDYPFQITILFPENIKVTSQTITVIGEAEYQSTITHQIFDSTGSYVDVNALFGTTYPYAITPTTLTNVTDSTSYTSELKFTDDTSGPCQYLTKSDDADLTNWNTYCTVNGDGTGGIVATQSAAGYRANVLCDLNDDKACTIDDVFTITQAAETPYDVATASFGTETPGGTALPITRCTGRNSPTSDFSASADPAEAARNAKACLQNTHFRLTPKGWCDVSGTFDLTVNAVCRDDANGDNTHGDSLVQDGATANPSNTYTDDRSGTALYHLDGTTGDRLYKPDLSTFPCDSESYRTSIDPRHTITFSLASDDFCARVIATGNLTSSLMIYDSENGLATWGADFGNAVTQGDIDTSVTDVTNSAGCTNADIVDGHICNQVPLIEITAKGADSRSTQGSFVFGTTAYLETLVFANAGVNLQQTTISSLFVANNVWDLANPDPTDATTTSDARVTWANDDAARPAWIKKLYPDGSPLRSYFDVAATPTRVEPSVANRVVVSNTLTTNSMISGSHAAFFTTNPSATGTDGAKLGDAFEGVSRASVRMDEYTIYITDYDRTQSAGSVAGEEPETVKFYANIDITYKAANLQTALGARQVQTSSAVPAGKADRARSLAAPAVTGSQASASATIGRSAASGTTSSSNIAGMSATTVLAAASVLGAVVVAAGASFFVVRKRRATAARTAKRSSSSTELNDTLAVQA